MLISIDIFFSEIFFSPEYKLPYNNIRATVNVLREMQVSSPSPSPSPSPQKRDSSLSPAWTRVLHLWHHVAADRENEILDVFNWLNICLTGNKLTLLGYRHTCT